MKQPEGVECVDANDIKIVMKTLSVNTTNDMEKATSQLQYDFLDSSIMKSPSSAASDMPEENRYPPSSIDKPSGPSEKNGKRSKSPVSLTSTGERPDSSEFDTPSSLVYAQTRTHKGLSNEVGENNCFLNVAIQTLWHLGPFRCEIQKLISSTTSPTGRDNDMMEALCNLFTQYEHTELSTVPPTELRKVLSGLFDHCKLGKIADANETLQAMLEKIHMECSHENPCLAHTVFGGLLLEQATCTSCGMTSEPKMRNNFMHYVYASELIRAHTRRISRPPGAGDVQRSRFGGLLYESLGANSRSCPSNDQDHYEGSITPNPILQSCTDSGSKGLQIETGCDGRETNCTSHSPRSSPLRSRTESVTPPFKEECQSAAEIKVRVVTPPNVLAISVGWTSAKQSIGTLRSFLSLISNTITLSDLCDIAPEKKVNSLFNSPLRSPTMSLSATFAMLSPSRKSPNASPTKRRFLKSSTPRRKSLNSKKWKPADGDTTGPSYVFRGFVCYYGSHYVSIFQVKETILFF
jgi:hypothetical protein